MPTYDYECKKCKIVFTKFLKIADRDSPEKVPCDNCNELSVVKKIGSPLISYQVGGILSRTDDGWKDTLTKIRSGSGRNNTIHVK